MQSQRNCAGAEAHDLDIYITFNKVDETSRAIGRRISPKLSIIHGWLDAVGMDEHRWAKVLQREGCRSRFQ